LDNFQHIIFQPIKPTPNAALGPQQLAKHSTQRQCTFHPAVCTFVQCGKPMDLFCHYSHFLGFGVRQEIAIASLGYNRILHLARLCRHTGILAQNRLIPGRRWLLCVHAKSASVLVCRELYYLVYLNTIGNYYYSYCFASKKSKL